MIDTNMTGALNLWISVNDGLLGNRPCCCDKRAVGRVGSMTLEQFKLNMLHKSDAPYIAYDGSRGGREAAQHIVRALAAWRRWVGRK